jgi:hypothetical protein
MSELAKSPCINCGIDSYTETCGICSKAFQDGARYVLEYLRDEVYGDGIEECDLWSDFFDTTCDDGECDGTCESNYCDSRSSGIQREED